MRELLAIAAVWRTRRFILTALASALVLRHFPRPVGVPGRSGGVEWVLAPVVPAALASLLPSLVRRAHQPLERVSGRFDVGGRLAVATIAWAACAAPLAIAVGDVRAADVRNAGLVTGVALLSLMLLPAALAWSPPVLLGVVTWLIGVPPPGASPATWVVLLAPASSSTASLVAAATLAAGATVLAACQAPCSWAGEVSSSP